MTENFDQMHLPKTDVDLQSLAFFVFFTEVLTIWSGVKRLIFLHEQEIKNKYIYFFILYAFQSELFSVNLFKTHNFVFNFEK